MNIYLFTLFGATILSYFAEHSIDNSINKNGLKKLNTFFLIALIIFLVSISGFRYLNYYQNDEYNYRVMSMAMEYKPFDFSTISLNSEWLFNLLSWISANVFHNSQFLIFTTALITNISIILFFAKYARPFWFAIFLYICGGAYFTSMNILRQYLALAIILWCYPLAKKQNFKGYFLLVILATTIHQSAWLMLPVYLVLRRKKIGIGIIVAIVSVIIIVLNFQSVSTFILSNNSSYEHYINTVINGYGVNIIRIFVWLIPYSIVCIFYKKLNSDFEMDYIYIFATLISACILIVSYKNVFFARLQVYFSIPALCAIIKIPELFSKKDKSNIVIKYLMLVLFFLFGAYQMSSFSTYHTIFEGISGILY